MLPLATVGPPSTHPSQDEMEYLVGFFDGDGCVTMEKDSGTISLELGQSLKCAKILIRFRESLGGGIYHHSNRTGTKKQTLLWKVSGNTMRHAAEVLSRVPSMKGAQLQIAAWGNWSKEDRTDLSRRLALLKQKEHVPANFHVSWSYFAGFFDAEGSISVVWTGARIRLEIGQMNPFVLDELQNFLHRHNLIGWKVYNYNVWGAKLVCQRFVTCQLTLQHLLSWGLSLKQKQAALALSLTPENHLEVRDAIFRLNGLQKQYDRLDDKGIARAKEIAKVSRQLRNASSQDTHDLLQRKVQELREQHVLQNLITKCQRLRSGIRQSFREGGLLTELQTGDLQRTCSGKKTKFSIAGDCGEVLLACCWGLLGISRRHSVVECS